MLRFDLLSIEMSRLQGFPPEGGIHLFGRGVTQGKIVKSDDDSFVQLKKKKVPPDVAMLKSIQPKTTRGMNDQRKEIGMYDEVLYYMSVSYRTWLSLVIQHQFEDRTSERTASDGLGGAESRPYLFPAQPMGVFILSGPLDKLCWEVSPPRPPRYLLSFSWHIVGSTRLSFPSACRFSRFLPLYKLLILQKPCEDVILLWRLRRYIQPSITPAKVYASLYIKSFLTPEGVCNPLLMIFILHNACEGVCNSVQLLSVIAGVYRSTSKQAVPTSLVGFCFGDREALSPRGHVKCLKQELDNRCSTLLA